MKKRSVVYVAFQCLLVLSITVPAHAQDLVIEGGTLIDGTGRTPIENAVIVMEGSRIKAVGTSGKVPYAPNARVIKADGKFILPGLIDVNAHYRGWDPQMFLHYGVTTIYDSSGPIEWMVAQREMINHGKIAGPRLFIGGAMVNGPANEATRLFVAQELRRLGPDTSVGITHVDTVERAQELVRKNAAAGADFVRVEEALTPELLEAVVEEARKHGLPVFGHSRDVRESTLAGLRYMEHSEPLVHAVLEAQDPKALAEVDWQHVQFPGAEFRMNSRYYDPIIKLMVSKGVFVDPTFALQWLAVNPRKAEWSAIAAEIAKEPGIEFVPDNVRQAWARPTDQQSQTVEHLAEGFKNMQEFTRQYLRAGGKVLVGTDSMGLLNLQGVALSFEMQSLVDAGAPPMQVIMAATKYAAEAGYKDKDLGTVESGKLADLVVVNENPLKDIAAVRRVALIVKDGKVIDRTYDAKFLNPIAKPLPGQLRGPDNGPSLSTDVDKMGNQIRPTVSPLMATAGDNDLTIRLEGKRFSTKAVVRFTLINALGNAVDTSDLKTEPISDSLLTAVIPRAILETAGTYAVTVVNLETGVKSNQRYFIVNFKY